jgi:aldehyde dehydrogenase (NAD+)
LNRLADLLDDRDREITMLIVREIGQPSSIAVDSQIAVAVRDLRNFAEAIPKVSRVGHGENFAVRRGVVGVSGRSERGTPRCGRSA